jgi:hypothetical protein
MARITVQEAQAWAEASKLDIITLDTALLAQVETMVLAQLGRAYDPLTVQLLWVNEATTPQVVRTLIAMKYVSFFYDRQYSEDEGRNPWARRLDNIADDFLESVVRGDVDIPEVAGVTGVARSPRFYPTDASSDEAGPTAEDPSAGPPQFSMGMTF